MTSYSYTVWTTDGAMVAYITDALHEPVQYQENLEGKEKMEALDIVTNDKLMAGNSGFYQSTIIEDDRLYLRTSKETGNSWEIKFDENWEEIPWPSDDPAPEPEYRVALEQADVVVRKVGSRITIIISGEMGPGEDFNED